MLVEQQQESESYFNFIKSLRTDATKLLYKTSLFQFVQYCNLNNVAGLMGLTNDEMRDKIVKYFLEKKGVSKATQRARIGSNQALL